VQTFIYNISSKATLSKPDELSIANVIRSGAHHRGTKATYSPEQKKKVAEVAMKHKEKHGDTTISLCILRDVVERKANGLSGSVFSHPENEDLLMSRSTIARVYQTLCSDPASEQPWQFKQKRKMKRCSEFSAEKRDFFVTAVLDHYIDCDSRLLSLKLFHIDAISDICTRNESRRLQLTISLHKMFMSPDRSTDAINLNHQQAYTSQRHTAEWRVWHMLCLFRGHLYCDYLGIESDAVKEFSNTESHLKRWVDTRLQVIVDLLYNKELPSAFEQQYPNQPEDQEDRDSKFMLLTDRCAGYTPAFRESVRALGMETIVPEALWGPGTYPGNSFDLYPIENCAGMLKGAMRQRIQFLAPDDRTYIQSYFQFRNDQNIFNVDIF
jgi:hypothetical protein